MAMCAPSRLVAVIEDRLDADTWSLPELSCVGAKASILLLMLSRSDFFRLRGAFFPLQFRHKTSSVFFAIDNHIHAIRISSPGGNSLVVLFTGRTQAYRSRIWRSATFRGTNAATHGGGKRTFDTDSQFTKSRDRVIRQPGLEAWSIGFLASWLHLHTQATRRFARRAAISTAASKYAHRKPSRCRGRCRHLQ